VRVAATILVGASVIAAAATVAAGRTDGPLPDPAVFLPLVRAHLFLDEELQRNYTYHEKRQQIRVTKFGKVELGRVRLFEVYASPEPGRRYRRLIADNGVPLDGAELARRDAEYARYLEDLARSRAQETPKERARRVEKEARAQRERDALIADVFRAYDMKLARREMIDGVSTIAVTLTPRPKSVATTGEGKHLKKFQGTAWVSETDYQVVRIDVECIDTVLVGWGLLGRVHKGSRLTIERRKVNGEVWLPRRTRIEVRGRSLLVRKFTVVAETEFSNYRKFAVDTTETFGVPFRDPGL
jgi:hypothetical protein